MVFGTATESGNVDEKGPESLRTSGPSGKASRHSGRCWKRGPEGVSAGRAAGRSQPGDPGPRGGGEAATGAGQG